MVTWTTILIVYLVGVIANYQYFRYDVLTKFGKQDWKARDRLQAFTLALLSLITTILIVVFVAKEYLED